MKLSKQDRAFALGYVVGMRGKDRNTQEFDSNYFCDSVSWYLFGVSKEEPTEESVRKMYNEAYECGNRVSDELIDLMKLNNNY